MTKKPIGTDNQANHILTEKTSVKSLDQDFIKKVNDAESLIKLREVLFFGLSKVN